MNLAGDNELTMTNVRAEKVREVARLATRTGRARSGEFLAEGPQAVREALRLHLENAQHGRAEVIRAVYATEDCLDRHPELEVMSNQADGVHTRLVSQEVLAAMADTVTPQGIVAVCIIPETSLQDIYNPKAVRSTVGSIFHLPIITNADFGATMAAFKGQGSTILAADGYGAADLDALQDASAARRAGGTEQVPEGQPVLEEPTVWVFGNEGRGLDETELAGADHRVAVPLYGIAESLNVGTAATMCLYASARAQRRG